MTSKKMDVDFWNSVFQWGSVALIAVTFFFGAGALWTGNRINERQTEQLVALEADLARAKTLLAEQQERAAKAEADLLRLQQRLAQRSLSAGQQQALATALSKYAGTRIKVVELGDAEAGSLAREILSALRAAQWRVTPSKIGSVSPPVYNVRCECPDTAEAATLVSGLRNAGITVEVIGPTPNFELFVGLKPPP